MSQTKQDYMQEADWYENKVRRQSMKIRELEDDIRGLEAELKELKEVENEPLVDVELDRLEAHADDQGDVYVSLKNYGKRRLRIKVSAT